MIAAQTVALPTNIGWCHEAGAPRWRRTMTLADECFDFVRGLKTESKLKPQLAELLEGLDRYSKTPWDYPAHGGSEIDALRRACKRVLARPNDKEALLWLLVLANCVQHYHDDLLAFYSWFNDHQLSDLDIWRADQLRQQENIEKRRCPTCGVGPLNRENKLFKEWVEAVRRGRTASDSEDGVPATGP
jgi:hypothetical protein